MQNVETQIHTFLGNQRCPRPEIQMYDYVNRALVFPLGGARPHRPTREKSADSTLTAGRASESVPMTRAEWVALGQKRLISVLCWFSLKWKEGVLR
jgi:hypothetical protein